MSQTEAALLEACRKWIAYLDDDDQGTLAEEAALLDAMRRAIAAADPTKPA